MRARLAGAIGNTGASRVMYQARTPTDDQLWFDIGGDVLVMLDDPEEAAGLQGLHLAVIGEVTVDQVQQA